MAFRLDQIPPPPTQLEDVPAYLQQLDSMLRATLALVDENLFVKTNVAPTKTEDGMLRYADGTNWNPGSGAGLYQWNGSAWKKLAFTTDAIAAVYTVNRALQTGAGGLVEVATTTKTELGYVNGVTSALQTQLDAKLASASYTAADVLAKLLTVDGPASTLDADTVDGKNPGSASGLATLGASALLTAAQSRLVVLDSQYTPVGNVGAGTDPLMAYQLAADVLAADGDTVILLAWFHGNAADNVTLTFTFDGNALDTSLATSSPLAAGADAFVIVTITRTGASSQLVRAITWKANVDTFRANYLDGAVAHNQAIDLEFFGANGTDTSNNAIVQDSMLTLLLRASA